MKKFITATASALALALTITTARSENSESVSKTNTPSSTPPTITVKTLLENSEKYVDSQVVLEGFVTDVCKRRGCWALLHDADPDDKGQIRVKQDESKPFTAFTPEIQGKTVLVSGEVHQTKIDAEYLDKWEARVKAAKQKADEAKTKAVDQKKDEKAAEPDNSETVLKQIAGFRKRVEDSKKGYLTSVSFAVTKWQVKGNQQ